MKRVVFLEDLKEAEIRPDAAYEEYKNILQNDIASFFRDQSLFVKTNCPGCSGKRFRKAFVKFTFQYCRCRDCGSLFVSPRPTEEMLRNFYQNSAAVSFWNSRVAERTKGARYRHFSFPMAQWVLELADEYLPQARIFLDYNSKHPDFLSAIYEAKKFEKAILVSPGLPQLEELIPKRDTVIYDDMHPVKEKVQVFTAFEVLERIFNPIAFIKEVHDACQKGGLFFLTTNTVSGFEYQMLNDKSPRLHPPDRINLLSIEAIQERLTESGFEVIELSTPGRLDVEIVRNAMEKDPTVSLPEFWQYILKSRDESAWHALQEFLQRHRLSSYVRVAARKK